MFKKIVILVSLTLSTNFSHASMDLDSIYLGGTYGRSVPFSGSRFKDSAGGDQSWGLYFGYKYDDKFSAELGYDKNSFSEVDFDAEFINLGGAYRPINNGDVSPVLRAAIGVNNNKVENAKDESGLGIKLGAGLEFHFPIITLTALADWRYLDKVSSSYKESQALVATVGFIWPPIKNSTTKMANQSSQKIKSENDQDHDGVSDSKDKCPNTTVGVVVNSLGCAKTETAVFKINVEFKSGKTDLQEMYLSEVEELANLMNSNPDAQVEIAGHTDNTGSEKINSALSSARAKAVADALVQKYNIDQNRIKSNGYGSTRPVADNNTEAGRKQNRRVEANISFQKVLKK